LISNKYFYCLLIYQLGFFSFLYLKHDDNSISFPSDTLGEGPCVYDHWFLVLPMSTFKYSTSKTLCPYYDLLFVKTGEFILHFFLSYTSLYTLVFIIIYLAFKLPTAQFVVLLGVPTLPSHHDLFRVQTQHWHMCREVEPEIQQSELTLTYDWEWRDLQAL